jgi:hypothetical protein
MMRRARWLLIGAIGGIAVYRRMAGIMRGFSGPGASRGSSHWLAGLRTAVVFLRDVREGMAEYAELEPARRNIDRQIPMPGNTLAGPRETQNPGPGRSAGASRSAHASRSAGASRSVSARGFATNVKDGH